MFLGLSKLHIRKIEQFEKILKEDTEYKIVVFSNVMTNFSKKKI